MNPRIKNLLEDIENISESLEDQADINPLGSPTKETKRRIEEIYQTAKRLGVYPD